VGNTRKHVPTFGQEEEEEEGGATHAAVVSLSRVLAQNQLDEEGEEADDDDRSRRFDKHRDRDRCCRFFAWAWESGAIACL